DLALAGGPGVVCVSPLQRRSRLRYYGDSLFAVLQYYGDSLFDGSAQAFSLDILNSDAAPLAKALSRTLDAAPEPRVVFELIIDPVILGSEADQQSGRFPVAGDNDLLGFGFVQKPREVVLDFG